MNTHTVHRLILDTLEIDLDIAQRAAQTAYETATHEENIAENKYDTLGLEASYLAAGQARRVEEIRLALKLCREMTLRPYSEPVGIQVGALLSLEAHNGSEQWLFLGPDAAGLKVHDDGRLITVITPRSPLGQALVGKRDGDDLEITVGGIRQPFIITSVQ